MKIKKLCYIAQGPVRLGITLNAVFLFGRKLLHHVRQTLCVFTPFTQKTKTLD